MAAAATIGPAWRSIFPFARAATACPPLAARRPPEARRKTATVVPPPTPAEARLPPGDSMTERHCACFKRAEAR